MNDGIVIGVLIGLAAVLVLLVAALVLSSAGIAKREQEMFNARMRRQWRGDEEDRRACYRKTLLKMNPPRRTRAVIDE